MKLLVIVLAALGAGLAVGWVTWGKPFEAHAIVKWRPPGRPPLSDAKAADQVRSAPETHPENVKYNARMPTHAELEAFRRARYRGGPNRGRRANEVIPTLRHVTGRFRGTTDEILQWAAWKWGIPEDLVRAVAREESDWSQRKAGDPASGLNAARYPAFSRISADTANESVGLMQVKWSARGTLHPGAEPLRWKSTAFNVDYWAANVRFFYDGGAREWFGRRSGYRSGQEWASIGAWFLPTPWDAPVSRDYIKRVAARLGLREWDVPPAPEVLPTPPTVSYIR